MPKNPTFELFELVCDELATKPSMVLVEEDLDQSLIDDLKKTHKETEAARAVDNAVAYLSAHLVGKGSQLPFAFDPPTRRFDALDTPYLQFITAARAGRGVGGTDAKAFEIAIMERLSRRLTGILHHVGTPRENDNSKARFLSYLVDQGWDDEALEAHDKDGGFDILWWPPLGAVPLRPVVSVQCKNSSFHEGEAAQSAGRALRTLARNRYVPRHHLACVVFNDYIDATYEKRARGWIFLPLGLTDFGEISTPLATRVLFQ